MHVAVVGSGPAGYFCAKALAERGCRVTILDVGKELEAERAQMVSQIAKTPREQWPGDVVRHLSENPMIKSKGVPRKLLFGSDFAYQFTHPLAPIDNPALFPAPTFAKGGYSKMWGGAALPATDHDLTDWPIGRADLAPYYQKVLETMPLCAGPGTLDEIFPEWTPTPGTLRQGGQGRQMLKDFEKHKDWLRARQVYYGPARLAIQTQPSEHSAGCNDCGFCLSGCPQGAIFATSDRLSELTRGGAVEYRANCVVHTVDEDGDQVRIVMSDERTAQHEEATFDAVFLGAGVINTTRILLASRELYDVSLTLKESQKFLLPVLRLKGHPEALTEKHVTLASMFIEARMDNISDHWVHVQMSPMNDMVMKALHVDPQAPSSLRRTVMSPLLKRMMIAWCGLHSDHGDEIEIKLAPPTHQGGAVLHIRGVHSVEGRRMAWRVARELLVMGLKTNTLFVPYPQFSEPGRATHCGGAFPMRSDPRGQFDSDVYGRPFGWKRIFAVDSSVFPSIPGTTIAFNIMANAYRIGANAPLPAAA